MRRFVDHSLRPTSSALTPTGGFLKGFTHTLQPYIGCRFGCEYCYVKESSVHRFHQPAQAWGSYVHPRIGIDKHLRTELQRASRKGKLADISVFMSSVTDPYQALERHHRLSRACLNSMVEFPPGLLVIQTRSPFVVDDFAQIQALQACCWLNITLETDLDEIRKQVTPFAPSIQQRLKTLQKASALGLNVQITVSPCLPFSNIEQFGHLLLAHAQRIIIDTYLSGDGAKGRRTAKSSIPAIYTAQNWEDWQSEENAFALYQWLHSHIGEKAGWSQDGFLALINKAHS